jgi:hypothetical protein
MDDVPIIRASELGQHAYCARAWWLSRVDGVQPSNTSECQAGLAAHARHGARVALGQRLSQLGAICLGLGGLFTLLWLASSWVGA